MSKKIKLNSNFKMDFMVKEKDTVIEVTKDVTVYGSIYVAEGVDSITIQGKPGVTLTIVSSGKQPAIGVKTDEQPNGTWSLVERYLKKVTIRGITVVLKSDVPNFTIGTYGMSYRPELCCEDGGSLQCIDNMDKWRILLEDSTEVVAGTTLRIKPVEYVVTEDSDIVIKHVCPRCGKPLTPAGVCSDFNCDF